MKKLLVLLLIATQAWAGLPPPFTKGPLDASPVETFETDFTGSGFTVSHAGTKATINFSGSGTTYYQTVQQNSSSKPQESKLNFSTDFGATDNSGNGSTDISLNTVSQAKGGTGIDTSSSTGILTYASGTAIVASFTSTFLNLWQTVATTAGDMLYYTGSTIARLGIGTQGQVLTVNSGAPSWQSLSAIGISTDDIPYTPTLSSSWGTVTGLVAWHMRVGKYDFIHGSFQTGTVTASPGTISLPSGETIDSSSYSATNLNAAPGIAIAAGAGGNVSPYNGGEVVPLIYDSATSTTALVTGQSGTSTFADYNVTGFVGNNKWVYFEFKVPISEWSSNTIGASQGAVYAQYHMSANASVSANVQINFDTRDNDSGALTGTPICVPGVGSFECTAPVSGTYHISSCQYASGSTYNNLLYVGGVNTKQMNVVLTGSNGYCGEADQLLSAGQTIDLRPDTSTTIRGGTGPQGSYISMVLNSGNGSGNVTSTTTGSEHIERYTTGGLNTKCTTSTCIPASNTPGISSVTRQSTGKYTINFNSGTFSATPTCVCNAANGANANVNVCDANDPYGVAYSTTQVGMAITYPATNTLDDAGFTVICMGPQ